MLLSSSLLVRGSRKAIEPQVDAGRHVCEEEQHGSRAKVCMRSAIRLALLEGERKSSLEGQQEETSHSGDGMCGFEDWFSLNRSEDETTLPPKKEKEESPAHDLRMDLRYRFAEGESICAATIASADLPSQI
mmetsp:Transcript_36477/g.49335  ORF Transcript_36477/g.49335 Transcript_36477/m.49335 type:complete len:132 (+) Transcript_36477:424-819(+)